MRTALLFIIFTWLLAPPSAPTQENPFVFSHLKETDGLSDNIINCFLKDSRGILWIGTYNGFNRYDGSNFFAYKTRKGSNSMLNEVVHSLCEDKKGNIWGATDNGVFCFEVSNDKFINYPIRSGNGGKTFYKIICDNQGVIWACGQWSILKFNAAENKFGEQIRPTGHSDSTRYFQIRKNGLVPDPSGNGLWLATVSGIIYYDIKNRSFLHCFNQPRDPVFVKRSTGALCQSASGNIWFFDNDLKEVILFDPSDRKILQRINVHREMPLAEGATIFEDRSKRLWFSSWTYELLSIDLANGNRISKLIHRPEDNRSIAGQFFWAASQDEDGTLWFGTVSGISRCNPEKSIYREFHLPEKIKELEGEAIHIAEEDPRDKSFWIITRTFLVIHYDLATGKYEMYDLNKAEPDSAGIKPGLSNTIRFLNDRAIISTYTGAWQIKKGSKKITPYDQLPEGYKDFKCSEIAFDGDSVIYCNNGKQLLYWNQLSGRTGLIAYPDDPSIPQNITIISGLNFKHGQKMWMVSARDHIAFRSSEFGLTRLKLMKDDTNENGILVSIEVDDDGNVWVLNKGIGLCRYKPSSQLLTVWDEADGLPANRMHKAKLDRAGRVWSMVYNKVSVFIPGPDKFYNFKVPISESKLNYANHISMRSNGNIIGTINNEIVEFLPDRIISVPGKRKPQISQLSINGKELRLLNDSKIFLQPLQNTIRLRFGILTDKQIFPYDLEYMLEGAEKTWTISTGSNEALYNNLSPGNYKFRVRARGKNNAWLTEEAFLLINIKTPFYKAAWFLGIVGLLLVGSLFFLYRYRIAQKEKLMMLESKAQLLEKEKAMVMYESLKQQLNPHFLFNSLTSLSGLIETDQQVAGNFLEQMSGIYRYILKNGDNETVSLKDEIEFVRLYIDLQQTRFKKGLLVNISVPEEYHHYKVAPVTLQNMIENAIKHNIIDAASPLMIDIFIDGDYLVVRNNMQKKNTVETSNKKGLAHFISLYKYLSRQPVKIEETNKQFQIKIPLI